MREVDDNAPSELLGRLDVIPVTGRSAGPLHTAPCVLRLYAGRVHRWSRALKLAVRSDWHAPSNVN